MMKKMLLLFLFLLPALSLRNGVTRFEGLSYQGTEEMSLITNILSVRGATYGAQDRLEFSNARTEGHVILRLRL